MSPSHNERIRPLALKGVAWFNQKRYKGFIYYNMSVCKALVRNISYKYWKARK